MDMIMNTRMISTRTNTAAFISHGCFRPAAVFALISLFALQLHSVTLARTDSFPVAQLPEKIAESVNADDRDAFLSLFISGYAYNGEDRESLTRYFFSMEGPRGSGAQEMKILSFSVSGESVSFEYEKCISTPARPDSYPSSRVCGGGIAVAETAENGLISALRPVRTYMKASPDAKLPQIEAVTIGTQKVSIAPFQPDLPLDAGKETEISCRITGPVESVSLALGRGLASAQMSPAEKRRTGNSRLFSATLRIPEYIPSRPGGRYYLYFKPYLNVENERENAAVLVVSVPVKIRGGDDGADSRLPRLPDPGAIEFGREEPRPQ